MKLKEKTRPISIEYPKNPALNFKIFDSQICLDEVLLEELKNIDKKNTLFSTFIVEIKNRHYDCLICFTSKGVGLLMQKLSWLNSSNVCNFDEFLMELKLSIFKILIQKFDFKGINPQEITSDPISEFHFNKSHIAF